MPINQPNNAAEEAADLRDDATAAAVIGDERLDQPPGGGGLGGASAAAAEPCAGRTPDGNAPNATGDVATPHGDDPGGEARLRSAADTAEPKPASQ